MLKRFIINKWLEFFFFCMFLSDCNLVGSLIVKLECFCNCIYMNCFRWNFFIVYIYVYVFVYGLKIMNVY